VTGGRTGQFRQSAGDPHVGLRTALLDPASLLPAPGAAEIPADTAGLSASARTALHASLREHGLALLRLTGDKTDERLAGDGTDEWLLRLGDQLGTPMAETDPAVQPFVDRGVILNLRTRYDRTDDTSLQPFAANYLSLHTESSGRPAGEQPRYIVLLCQEPGDQAAAQTVLAPMTSVAGALSADDLALLARVRYRHGHSPYPIVREEHGRPVFGFRDFLDQPLDWVCTADADEERVNAALRRLLIAMYSSAATGLRWKRGLVAVIDNRAHFHGRTAGSTSVRRPRHLRRLRLV
jgi:alpha-ketoglutarate-dependent taurine dioxygenase